MWIDNVHLFGSRLKILATFTPLHHHEMLINQSKHIFDTCQNCLKSYRQTILNDAQCIQSHGGSPDQVPVINDAIPHGKQLCRLLCKQSGVVALWIGFKTWLARIKYTVYFNYGLTNFVRCFVLGKCLLVYVWSHFGKLIYKGAKRVARRIKIKPINQWFL